MTDTMPVPSKETKGRSCLFYGCLTVLIIGVIVAVVGFLGARYALNQLSAFIEENTEPVPMTLPQEEVSQEEYQTLEKRYTAFEQSAESGTSTPPLVLTGRDINALIANRPDTEAWKDRIHISVEGDQITGLVSLPLDDFASFPGMSKLKGRYLNGKASLQASLRNGVLNVNVLSLEVKGQPLPEQFMTQVRKENLAKDMQNNSEMRALMNKLESIEVSDGKITVKARGGG